MQTNDGIILVILWATKKRYNKGLYRREKYYLSSFESKLPLSQTVSFVFMMQKKLKFEIFFWLVFIAVKPIHKKAT